jgi:hypothetical protein
MVTRTLSFGDPGASEVHARLSAAIESTPHDAVVQLRVTGAMPATLTAAMLRAVAGARTVTLARGTGHATRTTHEASTEETASRETALLWYRA